MTRARPVTAQRLGGDDVRPLVAVTLGDPGGIGPELVATVLADPEVATRCRALAIGDAQVLRAAIAVTGASAEPVVVADIASAAFEAGRIDVLTPAGSEVAIHAWGVVGEAPGRSALAWLTAAASLPVDGIVSAPLNKAALRLAGMRQADELELLTELTGSSAPALVGVLPPLWTLCVTLHVAFRDVPELVTRDSVHAAIHRLAAARKASGVRPRIAVAALNPHAGEGGHLGTEEIEAIEPAIAAARAEGIDVAGPHPADTLFPRALADGSNGVVCMYHDQANIARKLHPMRSQATLFLGLPVPVATTAHGTAFDRAGQGTASPDSLRAALDAVISLAGSGR